jgi:putative phosphoribosyl transferase
MFSDRAEAGRLLAEMVASRLAHPSSPQGVEGGVVLGVPRGGVPVAAMVAQRLGVPLDVLVVRKVGVPWQPELALGAVGEGGAVVFNEDVVAAGRLAPDEVDALVRKASEEVEDIVAQLRAGAGRSQVSGRMAIGVDDGVATGATARAAASVLRLRGSEAVILATPVATARTCESLKTSFDEVICLRTPWRFGSVGQHYHQFEQVSIMDVRRLLEGTTA